jgi:AcrR family transcriptional regulator
VTAEPVPDGARRRRPPSPPRPRGRPRLQDVEEEALAVVEALLAEAPMRELTMERVAQRTGIGKVTLYRRWPSRTALLADALMRRMAASMPLDETLPPPAAIAGHLRGMARELGGETGAFARAVVGECLSEPATAVVLRERYLGLRRDTAIRIIARGLVDGSFTVRGVEAEQLHDMLYGAVWYRFLFGVGTLDPPAALALMEAVLLPAGQPPRRLPRRPRLP